MTATLADNVIADFEEVARTIGRDFTDADIAEYQKVGVNLGQAAFRFLESYHGPINFLNKVKATAAARSSLTVPQVRAVLNIARKELLNMSTTNVTPGGTTAREYECYTCHQKIMGYDPLMEHKRQHRSGEIDGEGNSSVIESHACELRLDLSNLQDGRYAAPDLSGKQDLVFLMVRRMRRYALRDRLYVWGKIIRGKEYVQPGTIEIKEWSSDSKRLCGEQKPGDVYRGEFEQQLQMVLTDPETWAKLFGLMVGHCCICGKTLTDEDSRAQGIGPECIKKPNYFREAPKTYLLSAECPNCKSTDTWDTKTKYGRRCRSCNHVYGGSAK